MGTNLFLDGVSIAIHFCCHRMENNLMIRQLLPRPKTIDQSPQNISFGIHLEHCFPTHQSTQLISLIISNLCISPKRAQP